MSLSDRLQTVLGDAFRVERELGGGGMSRVFLAEEVALGRKVVIKLLPPDTAAAVSAERFRREIQLAARLQHPHIVPLISAGEMEGLPFYVMPFVEGESLRARLVRHGEMPIAEAVRTLREVASALAYAHERGVVHRDIKPENVLISHGSAMVTDFGVAKAITASADQPEHAGLTSMGMAMGTPAYMAPEQAAADPATDHRADIYALGVMAYEFVAGAPPFANRSAGQMLAAHLAESPEPVDQRRRGIPDGLALLIMQCLEKRPADRPQTAADVVRELDSIVSTGSITPVTGASRARRKRDMRRPALVAAAVVLLLVAGGALWGALRSTSDGEAGRTMLAVLPFDNQGAAEDAYFADGLTEAIANRLATLEGLNVIDRRSTAEYAGSRKGLREIGEELGVDYLLVGSVRWASTAGGERRVQISPSLVRVRDATTRWAAEPYVVTPTDIFEVQADVAVRVASALDVALGERERQTLAERPTQDAEAYDYFIRGEDYLRRARGITEPRFLLLADEMYGRAIERDPAFAAAYAKRARARFNYASAAPGDTARRTAMEAAMREALRVDATHPDTRTVHAWYLYTFGNDRERAFEEMVRAQAARPNDASILAQLASQLMLRGRTDEALESYERAVTLDPRSITVLGSAANAAITFRRWDDANRYIDRMIEVEPESWAGYLPKAQVAVLSRGDTAAARRLIESVEGRLPPPSVNMIQMYDLIGGRFRARLERMTLTDVRATNVLDSANFYILRGLALQRAGNPNARAQLDSALLVLDRLSGPLVLQAGVQTVHAFVNAGLGRADEARRNIAAARQSLPSQPLHAGGILINIAMAQTLVGDHADAIATLREVLDRPTGVTPQYIRIAPEFAALHGAPGWGELVGGR